MKSGILKFYNRQNNILVIDNLNSFTIILGFYIADNESKNN